MRITTTLSLLFITACGTLSEVFALSDQTTTSSSTSTSTAVSSATPEGAAASYAMAQNPTSSTAVRATTTQAATTTPVSSTASTSTASTASTTFTSNSATTTAAVVATTEVPTGRKRKYYTSEHRQLRHLEFVAKQDSLIKSHNYQFMPTTMQEMPGGSMQFVYNYYYYVGVSSDHLEVHMPTVRGGGVQFIEILNFDTFSVKDYKASQTNFGWSVSFSATSSSGGEYTFCMNLCTSTGEAVMNIMSDGVIIKYIGSIDSL